MTDSREAALAKAAGILRYEVHTLDVNQRLRIEAVADALQRERDEAERCGASGIYELRHAKE